MKKGALRVWFPGLLTQIAVLYLTFVANSRAEIVSFNFRGVITSKDDTHNFFGGGFAPGVNFTGNMTMDTSSARPDLYANDPKLGLYPFPSETPVGHFILTVTAGPHVVVGYSGGVNVFDDPRGSLGGEHLSYGASIKSYDGVPLPPTFTGTHYSIGFSKTTRPFNAISGDALPTGIPALAAFDIARVTIYADDPSRGITFTAQGQVLAVTPVPEPSVALLLIAGLPVLWPLGRGRLVRR